MHAFHKPFLLYSLKVELPTYLAKVHAHSIDLTADPHTWGKADAIEFSNWSAVPAEVLPTHVHVVLMYTYLYM